MSSRCFKHGVGGLVLLCLAATGCAAEAAAGEPGYEEEAEQATQETQAAPDLEQGEEARPEDLPEPAPVPGVAGPQSGPAPSGERESVPAIRPAYYLFALRTGGMGPCAERVGAYWGEYRVPRAHFLNTPVGPVYYYNIVYLRSYRVGSILNTEWREQGFTTAYVYNGCYDGYPAWGYYGAHKVSRIRKRSQYCHSGGCTAGGLTWSAWGHNW